MKLSKRILSGELVELIPLDIIHVEPLIEAVKDGELWQVWYATVPHPNDMQSYVEQAIAEMRLGNIAYAVYCRATNKVVGTTRFYDVESTHRRVKLGFTWYSKHACRTGINTETKLLMLQFAFDEHKAIAVEFRTHFFNRVSRAAIERLGAKQDGILRQHQVMADGSLRDTVVYSILDREWPAVKNNLLHRLAAYPS